jgi:hypothetical protein
MAGHQKFGEDSIGALTKTGASTVQLATSEITIGGLQYSVENLVCNTGLTGAGGIDNGSLVNNSEYKVFAVIDSGDAALVASLGTTPTGFTSHKEVGTFFVDNSSTVTTSINTDDSKHLDRVQKKYLLANSGGGLLPDLSFNNLKVGEWYKITMHMAAHSSGGWSTVEISTDGLLNSATIYGQMTTTLTVSGGSLPSNFGTMRFKATASTLRFYYVNISATALYGDGTNLRTWAELAVDKRIVVETTEFS